jgi:16S rRNA processing protein RimM
VNWDEMAVVGRIARAHGIRGQVIVNLETDFPEERFELGAELMLRRAAMDAPTETVTITSVRFHQGRPVIGIAGVTDMNAAIALAGAELRVPRAQLIALPAGMFYRHDLIGCLVERAGDGTPVGLVTKVEGSVEHSRLVVIAGESEIQIPLVAAICTTVDPVAKRIVIDPPDGLLELNVSASRKARETSRT